MGHPKFSGHPKLTPFAAIFYGSEPMYLMIAIQYGHVLGSFEKMLDCKCLCSGFQKSKSFETSNGF